jgi:hypothetical protein
MKQRTTGHLFPVYCASSLSNNVEILGTALPPAPTLTEEYLPGQKRESLHCNPQQAPAATLSAQESKLDVLWNNAGIVNPTVGDLSKQGYLKQVHINCYAPFLLTQFLLSASKQRPKQHPRTQFASSGPAP